MVPLGTRAFLRCVQASIPSRATLPIRTRSWPVNGRILRRGTNCSGAACGCLETAVTTMGRFGDRVVFAGCEARKANELGTGVVHPSIFRLLLTQPSSPQNTVYSSANEACC